MGVSNFWLNKHIRSYAHGYPQTVDPPLGMRCSRAGLNLQYMIPSRYNQSFRISAKIIPIETDVDIKLHKPII